MPFAARSLVSSYRSAGAAHGSFPATSVVNWICSSRSDSKGSSLAMAPANSAPDNLHICKLIPQRPIDLTEIPTLFRKPHLVNPVPFQHPEFDSSWPCLASGEVNPPAWGESRRALRSPARSWVSGRGEEAAHLHRAPRGFIDNHGIPSFTLPAPPCREV